MELAGEIRDEFLTCNICLEGYTKPKQLPCLHTFCLECLSNYIVQSVSQSGVLSVACPLCRRICVPPDPNPRKVSEWADQFPDNFFVVSLQSTVESRKERGGGDAGRTEDSDSKETDGERRSYFLGKAASCSKHLTHSSNGYCLSVCTKVCDACLVEKDHINCSDDQHLDYDHATQNALDLLEDYRQRMEKVKGDLTNIRSSFRRRPYLLETKKEETEISIRDYFSELRSECAKLLLAKEREMIDKLVKVVDDDREKSENSQKECQDMVTSIGNTLTLFDTLPRGGPFNAMQVLSTMEDQISKVTCLTAKMDQESKSDAICFQKPSEKLVEFLSSWDFGEIIDSSAIESLQAEMSEIQVTEVTPAPPESRSGNGELAAVHPQASPVVAEESLSAEVIEETPASTDGEQTCTPTNTKVQPIMLKQRFSPSAPPLDYSSPPPYSEKTGTSTHLEKFTFPPKEASAPPLPEDSPAHPQVTAGAESRDSLSARIAASPTLMAAYQRSMRREVTCQPIAVFSGNLPNEPRRGGLCGAAKLSEVNRAAFVDRHNHSVKIVDLHDAQIVGFLTLGAMEPWDITFIVRTEQLVVTCPSSRYLLFIPTNSKRLQITHHSATSVGYGCIAHIKEEEFAAAVCPPFGPSDVHIINMAGLVLRRILVGLCKYPRTIFCSPEGTQLVLSDWTSNVVFLASPEGEVFSVYREASGPKGVAVSELTNMLHVLDGKWSKLHLLDSDGKCIGSGKIEGCRDPRAVVVVTTCSSYFPDTELTVVADGNNALHIMSVSTDRYQSMSDNYQYDIGSTV